MKKIAFLSLILFLFSTALFGQNEFDLIWERTFSNSLDVPRDARQTTDGGYILVGWSVYTVNSDMWLVKIDENGIEEWNKTFGGYYADSGRGVVQTNDGGYAVVGTNSSQTQSLERMWLIKTDEYGNNLWDRVYTDIGDATSYGNCLIQTSDNGYLLGGFTGNQYFFLVKTDSKGNEEWQIERTFRGDESVVAIQQTDDNGFVIAINSESVGANLPILMKVDSLGNEEWIQELDEIGVVKILSMQLTSDNGYILSGFKYIYADDNNEPYVVKTDSLGNIEWSQLYGDGNAGNFNSVELTNDDGYLLSGNIYVSSNLEYYYLSKIDSSGNIIFENNWRYGISNCELMQALQINNDNYFVFGIGGPQYTDFADFYCAKLSSEAYTEESDVPQTNTYLSNYPNPFNPTTTIYFSTKESGKTDLTIYNIKGQKVKTLVNDELQAGSHNIVWNGKDEAGKSVSSGVYFYRLKTEKNEFMNKMILMK